MPRPRRERGTRYPRAPVAHNTPRSTEPPREAVPGRETCAVQRQAVWILRRGMRAGRAFGPPGTSAAAAYGGAVLLGLAPRPVCPCVRGPRASAFEAFVLVLAHRSSRSSPLEPSPQPSTSTTPPAGRADGRKAAPAVRRRLSVCREEGHRLRDHVRVAQEAV